VIEPRRECLDGKPIAGRGLLALFPGRCLRYVDCRKRRGVGRRQLRISAVALGNIHGRGLAIIIEGEQKAADANDHHDEQEIQYFPKHAAHPRVSLQAGSMRRGAGF
jgi:hypothetical protein